MGPSAKGLLRYRWPDAGDLAPGNSSASGSGLRSSRLKYAAVLFGAREAFYKMQYALTGVWLDFFDLDVELQWEAGRLTVSTAVLRLMGLRQPIAIIIGHAEERGIRIEHDHHHETLARNEKRGKSPLGTAFSYLNDGEHPFMPHRPLREVKAYAQTTASRRFHAARRHSYRWWRYPGAFPDANFNFEHLKHFSRRWSAGNSTPFSWRTIWPC